MAFMSPDDDTDLPRRPPKKNAAGKKPAKTSKKKATAKNKIKYKGREVVDFDTSEKPGTIIVRTRERALYQVLPDGRAMRYLVAGGKEGFSWSGVARIGMKRKNPTWTPPAEMIRRTPKYATWRNGMPGGIPENPLGAPSTCSTRAATRCTASMAPIRRPPSARRPRPAASAC